MGIEPTRSYVSNPSTALKAAGPTRRPDTPQDETHFDRNTPLAWIVKRGDRTRGETERDDRAT